MNELIDKFLGMNAETRRRTVIAIVVYILDFLVVFHVIEFSSEQIQAIAQLVAMGATAVAWVLSHYKNNDFTEEGCIGTGITRQLKREKEEGYVGDYFYTDEYVHEYEEGSVESRGIDPEEEGEEDE